MIQDGRSCIEQLQTIASEFDKDKLDIITNSDVKIVGKEGEWHYLVSALYITVLPSNAIDK